MSTTIIDDSDFSTGDITPDVDARAIIDDSEDMEEAAARIQYLASGLDQTGDEIQELADDQSDEHAALLWAHTQRTIGILDEISPLTENLLTPTQMGRLFESVKTIKDTLNAGTDPSEALYEEITGEEPGRGSHTEDIFSETSSVKRWLDRNLEDYNRRHVGLEIPDSIATGQNISSWVTVFDEFERDVGLAGGSAIDTKVISDPRSDIMEFLIYAAVLGVVGIFIPLMYLTVAPEGAVMTLGSDAIFWSQIIILGASAILSGLLIRALFGFLRKSMT